jgi:hypothetical protein
VGSAPPGCGWPRSVDSSHRIHSCRSVTPWLRRHWWRGQARGCAAPGCGQACQGAGPRPWQGALAAVQPARGARRAAGAGGGGRDAAPDAAARDVRGAGRRAVTGQAAGGPAAQPRERRLVPPDARACARWCPAQPRGWDPRRATRRTGPSTTRWGRAPDRRQWGAAARPGSGPHRYCAAVRPVLAAPAPAPGVTPAAAPGAAGHQVLRPGGAGRLARGRGVRGPAAPAGRRGRGLRR